MTEFLARLKQRKLVQWALAYIAAAFALIQVIDVVAGSYHWPDHAMHIVFGLLALGFVVALVIAWYHGEKGQQRVSGPELLLIALVLAVGGGLLWRFGRPSSSSVVVAGIARSHNAAVCGSGRCPRSSTARQELSRAEQGAGAARRPAPTQAESAQAIPAKSIAVLPFQNLSGDAKQVYFSDGITEEILNALAQIPDLKVAGRTSAFQFAGKNEDVRKVGSILGVATVLEGSVQKAGDEVRITAQLIDTRSGYQLWSEQYDRKLTNIFTVEDDISNAIMGKLKVQWNSAQPLVAQKTIDPRAHDFYLRGLTLLAARGPGLRDAVGAFKNAVKIDPEYADAWGAMAEAQVLYPDYLLGTMQAAYPAALADAQRALALNPGLASAYVAQGMVYVGQWRWPDADQVFRRALALAPNDVETVNQYAQFLMTVGQFKPSLVEIERAQRLDPLSASIGTSRAYLLMILHRYEAASAQTQRTLAAHPHFKDARANALELAVINRQYAEAEKQARLLAPILGADPGVMVSLVRGIADPALRAGAVRTLETSPAVASLRGDPLLHAGWLAMLGAYDRALDVLGRLPVERNSPEPETIWDPVYDPIRNDPRFQAVLKKMGLPYTPQDAPAPPVA